MIKRCVFVNVKIKKETFKNEPLPRHRSPVVVVVVVVHIVVPIHTGTTRTTRRGLDKRSGRGVAMVVRGGCGRVVGG